MSPPPSTKRSRNARRLANMEKYCPDRLEARRKRYNLLRLWKYTPSAEERAKQADALLRVMEEEDVAGRSVPAYTSWKERRAKKDPIALLPFAPFPPYPVSLQSNTSRGEGVCQSGPASDVLADEGLGDYQDPEMKHQPMVSADELHAGLDDRQEPGLNRPEDGKE
ncbi:hypothetical protein F5884DRAFT_858035 [Xylogone sp. PMI_703]|nr:hypothetical protein F5884DRAFT_858035 [Xylogone sp. PMI_703]